MTLYPIISGLALFIAIFCIHVMCWRECAVRRAMLWLLLLFIGTPVGVAGIFLAAAPASVLNVLVATMICLSCSVVYIQTYTAVKEDIPSFRILLYLESQDARGANESELLEQLRTETLFADKIVDLVNDSLISVENGVCRLKPAGRLLARAFLTYRRMLGLELGAG